MIDDLEDLDGQGPLWQQIRHALIKPISDGLWSAGVKIPKEAEIMARYGAARMTVHRALRSLAAEGVLARKRRFGTVVMARAPERPVLEIWDIGAEVERSGATYSFEILERSRLTSGDPAGAALSIKDSAACLKIVVRHFADGAPLQIEERLINLDGVPSAETESFADLPPGTWLIANVPWTEAEHTILAEAASPMTAKLLNVASGTACLIVERRTWTDSTPITWARLTHPGDKRRLIGRFRSGTD